MDFAILMPEEAEACNLDFAILRGFANDMRST